MDGENNGKPYEQMDDLGGNTHIFGNTHIHPCYTSSFKLTQLVRVLGSKLILERSDRSCGRSTNIRKESMFETERYIPWVVVVPLPGFQW